MGTLPGGDRAFIDPTKLTSYLLDPSHRIGRHKARVFASVLGLSVDDAGVLMAALKLAAAREDAIPESTDAFGDRYVIDFELAHAGRSARIKSSWIIRIGEDFPRFVTAMVAKKDKADD